MKYSIYYADRSGNTCGLFQTDSAGVALQALANGRKAHPGRVYGVYETDEPERGDVEADLEEMTLIRDAATAIEAFAEDELEAFAEARRREP